MTTKELSEVRRHARTLAYQRIREAAGIPEPSTHQRKLRRLRNERYRAKKRQEKAS